MLMFSFLKKTPLLGGLLILASASLVLSISSCDKDSKSEPKKTTEPAKTPLSEHLSLLQSSAEGWEAAVYPSNNQRFGGYTLYLSFGKDGVAKVASELLNEKEEQSSKYTLDLVGQQEVLTFDKGNKALLLLSEQSDVKEDFSSFVDDSFQLSVTNEQEVKLVGTKNNSVIYLRKAQTKDWAGELVKIRAMRKDLPIRNFILTYEDKTLAKGTITNKRHLSLQEGTVGNSYPFRYTAKGIELFQKESVGGHPLSKLVYNGDLAKPALTQVGDKLQLRPEQIPLTRYLLEGHYDLLNAKLTGRAFTAVNVLKKRVSLLQITLNSLRFGTKDKKVGVHIDAEQKAFGDRGIIKIAFTLPFLMEVVSSDEIKLTFNAGSIEGGIDPTQNSQLYNYTFGPSHYRFDLLAAPFANVKEIKVGKRLYFDDGNYNGRVFKLSATANELTLTDKSDAKNTITFKLKQRLYDALALKRGKRIKFQNNQTSASKCRRHDTSA